MKKKKNLAIILIVIISTCCFALFYFNSGTFKKMITWAVIRQSIKATIVPIEFYGKVIDQNDMPVNGANIQITIGSPTGTSHRELTTDDSGLFKLTGIKGKHLYIDKIWHSGYEQEPKARWSFNYGTKHLAKHIPDKNDPEIFRMWKKGSSEETEPLIKHDVSFKVKFDFTDYYVDLINGRALLKDTIPYDFSVRAKFEGEKVNNRFEKWIVDLESDSTNGGFIETDDIFLYKAPEDDYQSNITIVLDKKDNTWSPSIEKKFYLKSRNGKVYSSLICKIISHPSGEGLVSISTFINPNGSPNLEYNPAKRILD